MKNNIKIFTTSIFAVMIFLQVCGQNFPVTITIAVSPPYYPKISLYTQQPGKIMAIIMNTSAIQRQVYILGSVTGEGIRVYTQPNYKMPAPVILPPGGSFQISQNNIAQVFDNKHLVYEGITENQIIQQNGVPEGDYTICMRAYDYNTNEPLSAEFPQGCSNMFTITDIEPPVIINPVCGQAVYPSFPQNLVLNWTIPPGAPVSTQYNLKIIEVLPTDRNINDAMMSATHPVFFDKPMNISSCLLGPSDPQLVIGKTYAFTVTAFDPKHELAFRNNGMSEVCSFLFGGNEQVTNEPPIQLISPGNGDTVKDLPLFKWAPVAPREGIMPRYRLRLTEVLPGQNKDTAIRNSPHILKVLLTNSFPCPGDAVEPGKNYCWQVKCMFRGAITATSDVWTFSLPYYFMPVINLPGIIVHIETQVNYDNDKEIWIVEILLPSGEKIKVGFKDNPFLRPCDYILIKEITVKTIKGETWKIIKSSEKVDEAVAKKTWAKSTLKETVASVDKIKNALAESMKIEDAVVGAENKVSGVLDGMIKEGLPDAGGFNDQVKKAKEDVDFATDEETNPETGAKKMKDDVTKSLPGISAEITKIMGKIDKALELEKAKEDDEAIKNDAIDELAKLLEGVGDAKHKVSRAIDKEEAAKGLKMEATEQIDLALKSYKSVVPRSSAWEKKLTESKSTLNACLPSLDKSIELKKTALASLEEIEGALDKAKKFMEDALAAEQKGK